MIINCYILYFLLCSMKYYVSDSFLTHLLCNKLNIKKHNQQRNIVKLNSDRKNYHFSQRYTEDLLKRIQSNSGVSNSTNSDRVTRENIEAKERELHIQNIMKLC